MNLPKLNAIKIVEVGPRDGLQNEALNVSTADKFSFIKKLADSGLTTIEATSFVNPKWVPQMADAIDLFSLIKADDDLKNVKFPCLVPNQRGLESAIAAGVKDIAFFTATSDTFNKKNTNVTVGESLKKLEDIVATAKAHQINIRGYISTVFGCPYEGISSLKSLLQVIHAYLDLGIQEISLGDTIGVATPSQVKEILSQIAAAQFDLKHFAMHFHDTRGMAVVNSYVSLQEGIRIFDSSAGGLGGCPYANGATGNVATEDLFYLFESCELETGIDLKKLMQASEFILGKVAKQSPSKVFGAFQSKIKPKP
ncbi:hydroxymethylglutaryl-CoA lyase [bacterium K02(2017)]|nr:hydroxymethylglutaryl-CoA lyase [bacterium K02(2017)]